MLRRFPIFVFVLLLAGWAHAGEIVDRIVATVNGHVILQSDWEDALCYEAFVAGRPLDQITGDERKDALDRLIDQELLREQMESSDFHHASTEEIDARIGEVRNQYPEAGTNSAWQALLVRYGLTENELRKRIALQLDVMRLIDARLRPSVQIDSKSIESYYNQELLPQLREKGAREVPLSEVTPKIRELLTQQKVNQLLTAWLQNLRASSEIRTQAPWPSSAPQAR
ncbi:MAG TPA: SurA N-terminal domain-containing protein [Terriglobales bacterium]|nr:SurA N-terminal domain-containing protein [Terriglobales bacterium]